MMKLYKDYGVNPVGSCLPIFLQIPIFFGFFAMLGSAAELRGEHFLWVKDLSLPDTIFTFNFPFALPLLGDHLDLNPLPLVMVVTMFLQMKLTPQPATMDKTQQMVLSMMPFMFLLFAYNYAAALALYWSTQNVFSIGQSWIMKRMGTDDDGPLKKVERVKVAPPTTGNPFSISGQKKKEKKKSNAPRLGGR
jgi:YidC/Oxa1 family membrane protein insertase